MYLLAVQGLVGIIDQAKLVIDANQKLKERLGSTDWVNERIPQPGAAKAKP